MLRATIKIKHRIQLEDFYELLNFLKHNATGYEAKKSKVLTIDEIRKFLNEAPNEIYLATKVALLFGLYGGCRHGELIKLTVNQVIDHGEIMEIILKDTKHNTSREFLIKGESLQLVKAYRSLRPKNTAVNRFFLSYRNGKCIDQPLGKNKFGAMPKIVAKFLQLPNPELYTGHAFRRTSATLSAERGITLTDLKRLEGWEDTKVTDGCTEESKYHKRKTKSLGWSEPAKLSPSDLTMKIRRLCAERKNSHNTEYEDLDESENTDNSLLFVNVNEHYSNLEDSKRNNESPLDDESTNRPNIKTEKIDNISDEENENDEDQFNDSENSREYDILVANKRRKTDLTEKSNSDITKDRSEYYSVPTTTISSPQRKSISEGINNHSSSPLQESQEERRLRMEILKTQLKCARLQQEKAINELKASEIKRQMVEREALEKLGSQMKMVGERGTGAGKGGGGGGSIREAGGSFGKMEAAHEDQYFYNLQKDQITKLREGLHDEISFHEEQIKRHQEAINRHKKRITDMEKQ